AYIGMAEQGGRDLTLRDFVRMFRGLTGNAKAAAVCARVANVNRLADFSTKKNLVRPLLAAMREHAKAPAPLTALGIIGEEALRSRLEKWYGVKRWWYRRAELEVDGVPFVIEFALAETRRPGTIFYGVNFSPTFDDPLAGESISHENVSGVGVSGYLS